MRSSTDWSRDRERAPSKIYVVVHEHHVEYFTNLKDAKYELERSPKARLVGPYSAK